MIDIQNISFRYPDSPLLFSNLSLKLEKTSTTLLVGPMGAGKSTLVKLIIGILHPEQGDIVVEGMRPQDVPLSKIARSIGVVLQNSEDQCFHQTISEEISYGARNIGVSISPEKQGEILRQFGLFEELHHHPYDTHPVHRKLMALASSVAMDRQYHLFDEPTNGLTKFEKELLSRAFSVLRSSGKGYCIISHDLEWGIKQCMDIIVLPKCGSIIHESVRRFLRRKDAETMLKENGLEMPESVAFGKQLGIKKLMIDVKSVVKNLNRRVR